MRIALVKSLWGMPPDVPVAEKFRRISAAGYDGVEADLPDADPAAWKELCAENGLFYVAQIFGVDAPSIVAEIERAVKFDPVRIVAHSGRDRMSPDEGRAFFAEVLRAENDLGVRVAHETHRYRVFFTPWTTAHYLREFPELRINADFSHWCVVCESMLPDFAEEIELAASRAVHIHARVGYEEGPQVPDPAAPEFARHLARHEEWWDRIRALREADGTELLTVTPEYGPPNYLHTLPHTRAPVADLWQVCLWGAQRIRTRWGLEQPRCG